MIRWMQIAVCGAIFCAIFPATSIAADNELTAAEKAAGWRLLFDGKSYDNWVDLSKKSPPGDSFVIEDGCLKAVAHPKITEDLFTQDTFADFELAFDWKISPAGNSGVKYGTVAAATSRTAIDATVASGFFPPPPDEPPPLFRRGTVNVTATSTNGLCFG